MDHSDNLAHPFLKWKCTLQIDNNFIIITRLLKNIRNIENRSF